MNTLARRIIVWRHVIPFLILIGSLVLLAVIIPDPDVLWVFFVAPVLAFLLGVLFRPPSVWVVPAAVAVVVVSFTFVAVALDIAHPEEVGVGWVLSILSIGLLAVALPQILLIWAGKATREAVSTHWRQPVNVVMREARRMRHLNLRDRIATTEWRTIAWQYAVPVLILLSPIGAMIVTGADLGLFWIVILGPVLAFLIGVVFQPRRLWAVPTAVATVLALAIIIPAAVGATHPNDTGVTFVIRILGLGVLVVVLPQTFLILAGEALREVFERFWHRHDGPHVPAT